MIPKVAKMRFLTQMDILSFFLRRKEFAKGAERGRTRRNSICEDEASSYKREQRISVKLLEERNEMARLKGEASLSLAPVVVPVLL